VALRLTYSRPRETPLSVAYFFYDGRSSTAVVALKTNNETKLSRTHRCAEGRTLGTVWRFCSSGGARSRMHTESTSKRFCLNVYGSHILWPYTHKPMTAKFCLGRRGLALGSCRRVRSLYGVRVNNFRWSLVCGCGHAQDRRF
jgi:hypothetical protein